MAGKATEKVKCSEDRERLSLKVEIKRADITYGDWPSGSKNAGVPVTLGPGSSALDSTCTKA
jgi:hypothetical protein